MAKKPYCYTGVKQEPEAWVLPFPPGAAQPRRTLPAIPTRNVLRAGAWMPDSRHLVLGMSAGGNDHLWLADTDSNKAYQITTGTSSEFDAGVSPDGKTLAFNKSDVNLNVISVALSSDTIETLIGTERNERMAAWAAKAEELAYVTDRNGPMEVWIRSGNGSTRPAVTQDNFPGSRTHFIMDPALSPDASRLIFARQAPDGGIRNWIMSVSEGVPQRLNESSTDTEFGGAWSPDGRQFAYLQVSGKSMGLAIVTVGSAERPIVLRQVVWGSLPDASGLRAVPKPLAITVHLNQKFRAGASFRMTA